MLFNLNKVYETKQNNQTEFSVSSITLVRTVKPIIISTKTYIIYDTLEDSSKMWSVRTYDSDLIIIKYSMPMHYYVI